MLKCWGPEAGGPRAHFILWEKYLELLVASHVKLVSWFYHLVCKNPLRTFACWVYWKRKQITLPIPLLTEDSSISSWRGCWGYRGLCRMPEVPCISDSSWIMQLSAVIPSAFRSAFLCFFPFYWDIVDIQYHVCIWCGTWWLDICIDYEMITMMNLVTICPHAKLLHYCWSYSFYCIFHPMSYLFYN